MDGTVVEATSGESLALLDQLVPPSPSGRRRFIVSSTIIGLVSLLSWAWGGSGGWIIPQPFGIENRDLQGGPRLVADVDSDLVILAGISLPNSGRHQLRVTDVRIEGVPVEVVDARWAFGRERRNGTPPRQFFVIGTRQLPADVEPLAGTVGDEADTSSVVDIYLRPDCGADWPSSTEPAGSVSLRYEYPNRPSWIHKWVSGSNPIWAPDKDPSDRGYQSNGMIGNQALSEGNDFIPISDLKTAMCQLAGAES